MSRAHILPARYGFAGADQGTLYLTQLWKKVQDVTNSKQSEYIYIQKKKKALQHADFWVGKDDMSAEM
jgi:hypothetical protein